MVHRVEASTPHDRPRALPQQKDPQREIKIASSNANAPDVDVPLIGVQSTD